MKVFFLKSPTGAPFFLAHSIDDTADVPDEKAQAMIDAGVAISFADFQKQQGAGAGAVKETKAPAAPKSEKATSRKPAKAEKATKK